MILKLVAVFALLSVCWALPVEETKVDEVAPTSGTVPLEPRPGKVEESPKPGKPDDSDLKTDASTWWHHSWHYHEDPVYYYTSHHVPVYYTTYWKTHY